MPKLHGVMQSPGRPEEDTRGGFERGGWAAEYLGREVVTSFTSPTGIVVGTYRVGPSA